MNKIAAISEKTGKAYKGKNQFDAMAALFFAEGDDVEVAYYAAVPTFSQVQHAKKLAASLRAKQPVVEPSPQPEKQAASVAEDKVEAVEAKPEAVAEEKPKRKYTRKKKAEPKAE